MNDARKEETMECTKVIRERVAWNLAYVQDEVGLRLVSGRQVGVVGLVLEASDLPESVRFFGTAAEKGVYVEVIDTLEKLRQQADDGTYRMVGSNIIEAIIDVERTVDVVQPVDPTKINNAVDWLLAWGIFDQENEVAAQNAVKGVLYTYTDCGAWVKFYPCGVEIGSIVEGSDAEAGPYSLPYPFSKADLDKVIKQVEDEASDLWDEANGPDVLYHDVDWLYDDDDDPDQDNWWDETDLGCGG